MKRSKVCAVIVTYNRAKLLVRNIKSILSQSVKADIIIYDNASTDDTEGVLREASLLDYPTIIYHKAIENTGGAGGFSAGMRMAYEMGYDYIWLMDDDGYCFNSCTLENIFNQVEKDPERRAIYNSLVICDENETLSFSLFEKRRLSEEQSEYETLEGEINPFNATLIDRKLIEEIGVVNADLFIYGDEIDYIERAKLAGYEMVTVVSSKYYHPDSGMGNRKILGQAVGLRDISDDKYYYYTRNYMYIMCRYRTKKQAVMHVPKVLLKCFLYKTNRIKKFGISIKALKDGFAFNLKYAKNGKYR